MEFKLEIIANGGGNAKEANNIAKDEMRDIHAMTRQ